MKYVYVILYIIYNIIVYMNQYDYYRIPTPIYKFITNTYVNLGILLFILYFELRSIKKACLLVGIAFIIYWIRNNYMSSTSILQNPSPSIPSQHKQSSDDVIVIND